VFTGEFDRIKPREHNLLAVEIAETVFESRPGGRVYDRGVDGSVCRWAGVLVFEPPHRFVISWDISPRWQLEKDLERTSEEWNLVNPPAQALLRVFTGSTRAARREGIQHAIAAVAARSAAIER
jgi:uncharacterized protein YndB with AHSA1/START domain